MWYQWVSAVAKTLELKCWCVCVCLSRLFQIWTHTLYILCLAILARSYLLLLCIFADNSLLLEYSTVYCIHRSCSYCQLHKMLSCLVLHTLIILSCNCGLVVFCSVLVLHSHFHNFRLKSFSVSDSNGVNQTTPILLVYFLWAWTLYV